MTPIEKKFIHAFIITAFATVVTVGVAQEKLSYPIVDTGQAQCFDKAVAIPFPKAGQPFYGQDAQYSTNKPSYRDNGDSTVSDLVTGLMWTQDPGQKMTLAEALKGAPKCRVGGHKDWRLPSIKELYSLILLSGTDPDPTSAVSTGLRPFIDDSVFKFQYGNQGEGKRIIDSQYASGTKYVSTTMHANDTMFGVNFADGRIKGYPARSRRGEGKYYVTYVRGNPEYGKNKFRNNRDGTITDHATGLSWTQTDSGKGMDWQAALEYAEQLEYAGHSDWRLPTAKELQSIVDYTRSPDTTGSAAIDPIFNSTEIKNEGGKKDFAYYWSSSSHQRRGGASTAAYLAFGRAGGFMKDRSSNQYRLLDVHGAGAQRSDPKTGDASRFPHGRGPQGDVIRIENMVRCVRGGNVKLIETSPIAQESSQPQNGRPGGNRFFDHFDKNKDGRITKGEFDGPSKHFLQLDRNGDNIITQDEAPTGPPPPRRDGPPPGTRPDAPPKTALENPTATSPDSLSEKPNFVFLLIDDIGWTGLSIESDDRVRESKSDYHQTPNIEKLARQGMRFSRAYSPGSLCTPTRASILTGKTPAQLHITTPGGGRPKTWQKLIAPRHLKDLPASEITIAEALKKVGYTCAHLGKWHLGRSSPGEHGFDVHDGPTGNDPTSTSPDTNPKDIFGLTKRAISFMKEQAVTGKPFYLQVSHYAIHTPVEALNISKKKFAMLKSGERHHNVENAAMIYDLDTSIGMLLKKIDEMKLADNTYVVLMSDNGAHGNQRRPENQPLSGGKGSFYEGGIRVPFMIRGPGIRANSFCRENVTGCDLFPSFCEWAGVPVSGIIEGVSLVPLLMGQPDRFRRSEEALLFHYPHYGESPKQKPQSAVIMGSYKLIKDLESGKPRLFDLDKDISELNDLAGEMPGKAADMTRRMGQRLKELNAQMPLENPDYDPNATPETRGRSGQEKGRKGRKKTA